MAITDFPGNNLLTCDWGKPNNILFQVANSWLCVLYIGDFINFSSTFAYLVFLRATLLLAALFFSAWGGWVLCSPDTALWNFVFFIYNLVKLLHIVYLQFHPAVVKPKFEKLYNSSYKFSGLSLATYNQLVAAGIVISASHFDSDLFKKSLHSQDKIFQIISGKVLINLINGVKVRLREGDFINDNNWNFNNRRDVRTFVVDYTIVSDCLLISWPHSRLTELLHGPDRRLFSYLLLSNLSTLLLRFSDLFNMNLSTSTSNLTSITVSMPPSSDTVTSEVPAGAQPLLLHKSLQRSSSSDMSDNADRTELIHKTSHSSIISGLFSDNLTRASIAGNAKPITENKYHADGNSKPTTGNGYHTDEVNYTDHKIDYCLENEDNTEHASLLQSETGL